MAASRKEFEGVWFDVWAKCFRVNDGKLVGSIMTQSLTETLEQTMVKVANLVNTTRAYQHGLDKDAVHSNFPF